MSIYNSSNHIFLAFTYSLLSNLIKMDSICSVNVTRSLHMVYSIKPLYKWQYFHQTELAWVFPLFKIKQRSHNLSAKPLLQQEMKIYAADHSINFQSSSYV